MKRGLAWVLPVVLTLGLSGCAVYKVAGTFEGSDKEFFGTVTVSMVDAGTLKVATLDGLVQCEGSTQVTKRPSGYTGVGARGLANATCNDGRTFKVDFVQTSSSGGHGKGIDSQGNIVSVYFDKSGDLIQERVKLERLERMVQ